MPIDNDAALDAIRQGSNSFKVLVATLGGKPDEVKRVVKRLRHAGAIDVDGHSRGARYRVANDAPRERTPTRSAPPPGADAGAAASRGVSGGDRPPRTHRRAR